jgi:hypothetical protein
MKTWYTYHLIDPETNVVFYVGKGHGRRMYAHLTRALKWRETNYLNQKVNKHLYYKLLQIHDKKLQPIYLKVLSSEIETETLSREMEDIKEIGIENLCNLTYGGEGETRSPEALKKLSESLQKFWSSENGKQLRIKYSEDRVGENNPMWGTVEDEEHKIQRMIPMLSKPRWNKGLKGDPRSAGPPKGELPPNALKCRLTNEDGRIVEANSLKELSILSGVPLISISRMRAGKKNKKGWRLE